MSVTKIYLYQKIFLILSEQSNLLIYRILISLLCQVNCPIKEKIVAANAMP